MSIGDVVTVGLLIGNCKFNSTPHAAEIPLLKKNRCLLNTHMIFKVRFNS